MNTLTLMVKGFEDYQQGRGLSAGTITRNGYLVKKFLRWLKDTDIREVGIMTLYEYRQYLKTAESRFTGKPITVGSRGVEMTALKGFFEYLARHEYIVKNPLEGVSIKEEGVKKIREVFSEEDIATFLDSISVTGAEGIRDRALFELMYSSGLRVGEVRNLEMDHLNLEERVLLVKQGKGKKDRYVPFSVAARRFLLLYLSTGHNRTEKQRDAGYVFTAQGGRISYKVLRKRFLTYLDTAGLKGKGYTMHSIRHATGTHLLKHGASIRYVQELLGHEDLKTTQLYTRPEVENIKAVYRTYHPRENEYYREVDAEYLRELSELQKRLLWGKKVSGQYRQEGHKRGYGRWRGNPTNGP